MYIKGDIDNDGDTDFYVTCTGNAGGSALAPDGVLLNVGNGQFQDVSATHSPQVPTNPISGILVDIDQDGDLDVALGGYWSLNNVAQNFVFLNDGTGRFYSDPQRASMPPDNDDTTAWAAGDIDGDGDIDLVAGNFWVGNTTMTSKVLVNNGTGHFTVSDTLPPLTGWVPHLFDLDNDGDLDLATFPIGLFALYPAALYLNDGTGRFADATGRLPTTLANGAAIADFDEDGDLDIACSAPPQQVAPNQFKSVFLWDNDGTGHFTDITLATMPLFEDSPWGAYAVSDLKAGDLDGDGDIDLVISPGGTFGPPYNNEILWNMTRHVYAPRPPRLGQPYVLEFHGARGQVVLPAAAFQPRHTWLGDVGVLGLDPATLVTGIGVPFDAQGRVDLTFQVPNDAALLGVHIYWQGLVADPAVAQPYKLTNTFEDVFER